MQVAGQIEDIEDAHGRVVGVYYADNTGTPLDAESTDLKMDEFGWESGYRISDETRELWNATTLWPGAPGVFVVRTEDMQVVASEATGPIDIVAEAAALDQQ